MGALDRLKGRNLTGIAVVLVAVLLMLGAPTFLPTYYLSAASRVVIIGTFAVAYNVVFGMGGMPSLGHAAFFGAGGYVVALGVTRWGWGFPTIVMVAIVVGAIMGLIFGVLSQRVEGIYLLLMTLALGQAVWGMAFQMVSVTSGDMGISGFSSASIPLPVGSRASMHYFSVAVCVALIGLLWWFMRSPVGRAIVGIRESPSRMGSLGYSVAAYKITAFFVSGTVSAVVGGLYAYQQGYVGPENLDWVLGATVLLAAVLGGARHFLGPALGAALLIIAETVLGNYTARWMSALGVIYIVTIMVLPDGILGFRRHRHATATGGQTPTAEADDDALLSDLRQSSAVREASQ